MGNRAVLTVTAGALFLCASMAVLPGESLWPQNSRELSQDSIDRRQLVFHAERFLARNAQLRAGTIVLIVSDRSVDEWVRSSFFQAAAKLGATAQEIVLQGQPEVTDGLELARRMRFKVWYPNWIWKAASEADLVLGMTNLGGFEGPLPVPKSTRWLEVPFARREQLADPGARGNYPDEILKTIARVVWEQMRGARRIHLTDIQGTDLKWSLDEDAWEQAQPADPTAYPTHISLPRPYRSHPPDMEGWIVGSATHSGPLPLLRLKIQGGKVVEVHEGGHVGEYLRRHFSQCADIQFPGFPGPGSNWVEEAALGTHPRHRRVQGAESFGWSAQMSSWIGAPRAGVFHVAVGFRSARQIHQFIRERGLELLHLDVELYYPTLVMDGRVIISRGRLMVLDDPAVRQVASRYGNPDELLKVSWFPEVQ